MKTFGAMCIPDLLLTKAAYEAMIQQIKNTPLWSITPFEKRFDPEPSPSQIDRQVKNRTITINRLKELIAVIQRELAFHE